jgi:hypothetical protein
MAETGFCQSGHCEFRFLLRLDRRTVVSFVFLYRKAVVDDCLEIMSGSKQHVNLGIIDWEKLGLWIPV